MKNLINNIFACQIPSNIYIYIYWHLKINVTLSFTHIVKKFVSCVISIILLKTYNIYEASGINIHQIHFLY